MATCILVILLGFILVMCSSLLLSVQHRQVYQDMRRLTRTRFLPTAEQVKVKTKIFSTQSQRLQTRCSRFNYGLLHDDAQDDDKQWYRRVLRDTDDKMTEQQPQLQLFYHPRSDTISLLSACSYEIDKERGHVGYQSMNSCMYRRKTDELSYTPLQKHGKTHFSNRTTTTFISPVGVDSLLHSSRSLLLNWQQSLLAIRATICLNQLPVSSRAFLSMSASGTAATTTKSPFHVSLVSEQAGEEDDAARTDLPSEFAPDGVLNPILFPSSSSDDDDNDDDADVKLSTGVHVTSSSAVSRLFSAATPLSFTTSVAAALFVMSMLYLGVETANAVVTSATTATSATAMATDASAAISESARQVNMFDPALFQPVCPASDGVYQVLKSGITFAIGPNNVAEYGPLIASVLLRVRLELCVFESFVYEAVVPFIKLKGLSWVLPLHETVETFVAGTIFAVASNFILLGSTKIFAVMLIYIDAIIGFPIRLIGEMLKRIPAGKPGTDIAGSGIKAAGDLVSATRNAVEKVDTFVGRYLVFATTLYIAFKFVHFKLFNDLFPL